MSSGEIFLVLGALILLSFHSISVNRTYVTSVRDSVEIQKETEAIQFGHYVVELMYNYSTTKYDSGITDMKQAFYNRYGNCSDINNSCINLETRITNMELKATIELVPSDLADDLAIVTVYEKLDGEEEYKQRIQLNTAITYTELGSI